MLRKENGNVIQKSLLKDNDLELINKFTLRELTADEIYNFSAILCDNEVDRDFERFSLESLEVLQGLFVGKTCIFDHDVKNANQTARIYHTEVEEVTNRSVGSEPYTRLVAKMYLPKNEKNKSLIDEIESGILKEVSVSCSIKYKYCSICGKVKCQHRKGETYHGELCHIRLEEPTDAYECSFVAVPAQRSAGVRKKYFGFKREGEESGRAASKRGGINSDRVGLEPDALQKLFCKEALSGSEIQDIREYVETLEAAASWGKRYRTGLFQNVIRYSGIFQPEMPKQVLRSAMEHLSVDDLQVMEKTYQKLAETHLPLSFQLMPQPKEVDAEELKRPSLANTGLKENREYQI